MSMKTIEKPKKSPLDRALQDAATDRSLADELRDDVKLQELHAMCLRMIDERKTIAEALCAMVNTWNLMSGDKPRPNDEAMFAIERVAHEAIAFAREVVSALTDKRPSSSAPPEKP